MTPFLLFEVLITENSPECRRVCVCVCAGTSTPPGISAAAVPSIAAPIGVNGFTALPPQSNGQPTSEPIYTNGIHPYPGERIQLLIQFSKTLFVGQLKGTPGSYSLCLYA